ncbi:hypothetical protein [Absidia glauca]|uniref:Uncharacterized protein n=1 Tax=Absidia glauca TaxID=4829 RepID=A0A163KB15_ABSGL|nr:hypothetical protein [Absidia glauca]
MYMPLGSLKLLVGIGTGLHKCANSIGTTIIAVLVGYVQDLTYHDGDASDDTSDLRNQYDGVMILYLCLGCGLTFLAVALWWMDRRQLSGWLQADKKDREHRIEAILAVSSDEKNQAPDLSTIGSQVLD